MVDPAGPDVPLRTYQYSVACLKFTIPLYIELSRLKVALYDEVCQYPQQTQLLRIETV